MTIKTVSEARKSAQLDAVSRARAYLERDAPNTLPAIDFWVETGWGVNQIMAEFVGLYGVTEEKTMHKIKLCVEAAIMERDE